MRVELALCRQGNKDKAPTELVTHRDVVPFEEM